MNILVFGGVGFIGTNVCLEAITRRHKVIAFDNLKRPGVLENLNYLLTKKNFNFIHGDIRSNDDFTNIPNNIDIIINLAANPSVPRSISDPVFDFMTNVYGHINILEYSKKHGKIPIIFASSNKVYTDKINYFKIQKVDKRYEYFDKNINQFGLNESNDVDGHDGYTNSPYGSGKLAAEKYTREYWKHYKIPICINRMSCIYGLYQKGVEEQGWLDWFLRAKKEKLPIFLYGDGLQVRDVLFGSDVAKLYLTEAENIDKVNGMTFNVGGGVKKEFNTSLLEVIELINKTFTDTPDLKYSFKSWRNSDQRVYISDTRFVSKVTGWIPKTTITKALKLMWPSYK